MKQLNALQNYYIVWFILGLSCIPYILLKQYGLEGIENWFVPNTASELWSPFALWRLWTPTFIHYTLPHLVINLYLWWLLASKIEQESRLELMIILVFSAAGSNLLQWWLESPNFGGLSGVVYALMAYLYLMHRFGGKVRYQIDSTLCLLMLALIPLGATGIVGQFANYAHIGGLCCGALLASIYLGIIAFVSNPPLHDDQEETSNE